MTTDYSQFLRVHEDGCIWWRLEDAIKLGAGYLPVRDDERDLLVLRAPNDRVLANERTLLGDFHKGVQNVAHPQRQERDGDRFVRAREFIEQHITVTQATIPFPSDLARAVREAEKEAEAARAENAPAHVNFESLEAALEGWLDKPFAELPADKRLRMERDLRPMLWVWDKRTEGERRSDAKRWDYLHDPELEPERQRIFDLQAELYDVHRDIRKWELKATSTAGDEAIKEDRLKGLRNKAMKLEDAMARDVKGRQVKRSKRRKVEFETTLARADDRAFWRGDEHFPQHVFIETALRMWMLASFVLRDQKSPASDSENIRKLNSIDVRIFAGLFADKVKEQRLQIYGGRMLVRISDNQREEILKALCAEDPLSRAAEYDGCYFLGEELYAAIDAILPESKKDDESLPPVWWELRRTYGKTKACAGDKRGADERHDAISIEIEEAINQLGDQNSPHAIMHKLKGYASKQGSCITEAGVDFVLWRKPNGQDEKLDMKALQQRLTRRTKKLTRKGR